MKRYLVFLVVSGLSVAPVAAKPHRYGDQQHWNQQWSAAHCYLQPGDVRIIREYYAPRTRSLPPGLAKKFARTGHLPPGWERKLEPLPVVVERRLVVLPPEWRRGYVDGSVVVYSPRTNTMIDIVALIGPY